MTMIRPMRSLLLLWLLLLPGCDEVLYDDLTQREANQIVSALQQAGIQASRVAAEDKGIFSVTVAEADFASAIALLEELGLPQKRFETMADVFNGDGMLSSPLQERARLAYALSQELTRSLTTIDGILDARVHLTLARDKPLTNDLIPATASVLLTHRPDFDAKAIIPDVKFLVAKGVPNLSYRDVSVVTLPHKAWPGVKPAAIAARPPQLGLGAARADGWDDGAAPTLASATVVGLAAVLLLALLIRGSARGGRRMGLRRWLPQRWLPQRWRPLPAAAAGPDSDAEGGKG